MNICLLTWWGDSLTYTMARALAHNGHRVDILITDRERHLGAKWGISARIREIPQVRLLLDPSELAGTEHDFLIVQSFPRLGAYRDLVADLARRVAQVTLVSFGDKVRGWQSALKLQLDEWRAVRSFVGKLRTVAYKDGFHRLDAFAPVASRVHVGFDVHSKFLHVDALYRQIHATDWQVDGPRAISVNFVGSRDPARRGAALDQIKAYLDRSGSDGRYEGRIMWRVYSDTEPGALPESEFVDRLSNSDFTLAPPGHSLITHRPVEAMLRGSVPILNADEAPIYELGLRDGENCLLVQGNDWAAAVERAMAIPAADLARMRTRILQMNQSHLQYAPLSAAICRRLGVPV
jgi:hypothetical protein